jgi:hypothetical protein
MVAIDSPSSHQSFGMNTELSGGQDGSDMDLPSSAEAQDDKDMYADWDTSSSRHSYSLGDSSPKSQHSFGINSMLLPEGQETPAVPIPDVQELDVMMGMESLPLPEASEYGIGTPLVHIEESSACFPCPGEHEDHVDNLSAAQEVLEMDHLQPTDLAADSSATHGEFHGIGYSVLRFALTDTYASVVSSTVSGNTSRTTLTHSRCVVYLTCLLITRIGVLGFTQLRVSGISGRVSYVFHVSYDSNTYSPTQ